MTMSPKLRSGLAKNQNPTSHKMYNYSNLRNIMTKNQKLTFHEMYKHTHPLRTASQPKMMSAQSHMRKIHLSTKKGTPKGSSRLGAWPRVSTG